MNGWKQDKRWSDRFLGEIKAIIGSNLIGEPPIEEDAERNTDLMVLKLDAVRVACRIRKFPYFARYGGEFTIRAGRPSGTKTELTKVIEGWGDYFFYGFADEREQNLCSWKLADLKVFRAWFNRELVRQKGVVPGAKQNNKDNSSNFISFKWDRFPIDFVIAESSYTQHKASQ